MSNILVTGGAGYIGSHTILALKRSGYEVVVFDNLSKGHQEATSGFNLMIGDLENRNAIDQVFSKNNFEAVIHLAGSIEAGESMINPQLFFQNNLVNGINLLETMLKYGVKKIVFSSTAAVYGEPKKIPLEEDTPKKPTNVYGLTKLMLEQILEAYDRFYELKSVCLRYFNAAGADPSGNIGEDHDPETHLIPLVLKTALREKETIKIFGTDYSTPDGTCVRDYVHVSDLADAHILALRYLEKHHESNQFNLGNEKGNSVREIIETAKKITGTDFPIIETKRRPGDPAKLCASSQKAEKLLGWKPKYDNIEKIIETAWNWHKSHPKGFK